MIWICRNTSRVALVHVPRYEFSSRSSLKNVPTGCLETGSSIEHLKAVPSITKKFINFTETWQLSQSFVNLIRTIYYILATAKHVENFKIIALFVLTGEIFFTLITIVLKVEVRLIKWYCIITQHLKVTDSLVVSRLAQDNESQWFEHRSNMPYLRFCCLKLV